MGVLSVKEIKARHTEAMRDKERWRSLYRDAYRLQQPARDMMDQPQRGQRKHDVVFDSTAVKSGAKAANRIQDLIFPTGKNIVEPKPGPLFSSEDDAVKKQIAEVLTEANKKWHAALWRSNFQSVINEGLQDLLIGTMSVLFNEGADWDPFHFTAVPQFAIGFREGPWGTISEVSREVKLHPRVAALQWPNSRISDKDQANASEGDADRRKYIEITYPDESTIRNAGGLITAPTRWFYVVVDDEKDAKIFDDLEIETASPWIVGRWQKAVEEIRGRGPILQALPDIRTANKVVELILKNASLAITGLWTGVDDGVFNPSTARFQSGSVIPVASNGGSRGPSIQALEFPGNFDVSQLVLTDLRENIRQSLFDANLPPLNAPVRSATEFVARLRDLMIDIGPASGRIQKEILEPLYLRGLHILRKKGIVDLPEQLQLDSQTISLDVVSPLAQRQALDDIQKVVQWLELSSFLGPEIVALKVSIEDIPEFLAEKLGIPLELLRDAASEANVVETVAAIATSGAPGDGQQQVA